MASSATDKARDRAHLDKSTKKDAKTGSYSSPPWTFTGKALYQLSLVRVKDARKYVPESIPLVNIFGYTLGGFYLARYDGSPAGQFDELVALAGLAWNFPTSCAWAARVYVNNDEAKRHGLDVVGLPSRGARFTRGELSASSDNRQRQSQPKKQDQQQMKDWWGLVGPRESSTVHIFNSDVRTKSKRPVCSIDMSSTVERAVRSPPFMPKIQMFLPSFSGATARCPDILKYSLRLSTSVRFLKPMRVTPGADERDDDTRNAGDIEAFVGRHVLCGRPLVCMSFENMKMEVQAPEVFEPSKGKRT